MMNGELKSISEKLVAHCRNDTTREGLEELYAEDALSCECAPGPDGTDPVTRGLDGIRAKHDWWDEAMEVHEMTVDGPYLHGGDRFALIFSVDATERASGRRFGLQEVAVYHVAGGKIVREEFFNIGF